MIVAQDPTALRHHLDPLRAHAERVAFVPTMGNLHAGHLALVTQALETGAKVVVSIFVNPMQFAAGEDLDSYPRTLDADLSALDKIGADVVFTPREADIYPYGRHMESLALSLSLERVRRSKLVYDLIQRECPDAQMSKAGLKFEDLGVPEI